MGGTSCSRNRRLTAQYKRVISTALPRDAWCLLVQALARRSASMASSRRQSNTQRARGSSFDCVRRIDNTASPMATDASNPFHLNMIRFSSALPRTEDSINCTLNAACTKMRVIDVTTRKQLQGRAKLPIAHRLPPNRRACITAVRNLPPPRQPLRRLLRLSDCGRVRISGVHSATTSLRCRPNNALG